MASPARRCSTAWPIERQLRRVIAAALLALTAQPALAQDASTDPELEALIPDGAVAQPDDWAKGDAVPVITLPLPLPDPTAPLADLPGALPWPDDAPLPQSALAPLEPEPGAQLAIPELEAATVPQGAVMALDDTVEVAFPEDLAEREEIAARFRQLSALVALDGRNEDNLAQVSARAKSDRALLERVLRVYGYYGAQVQQVVGGIEPGKEAAAADVKVRFDVFPGPRFAFGAVDLGQLDRTGPDYPALRDSFGIKTGDPLYADVVITERVDLDTTLGESGYAFAKVGEPDQVVDHARDAGDLTVPVDPGGKYRFGAVVSDLPKYLPGWHLEEIARFDRGDVFQRSLAEDLRRAVLATGLVGSATVTPREVTPPGPGTDGVVALDVALTKAPVRTIAGAVGYDSGDGFRVEASWEHRNLFPPEGLLRVRGIAGTKEQLAGVTFRRNNFKGRDQILTFDLFADNVNRDAYAARTVAFSGTFEKITTLLFQKPWTWSVGTELVLSDEREAKVANAPEVRRTFKVAALPVRAAFDGSDNLLDPTRGFRAALRVSPEVSFQAGTAGYARIQADASYYQPVSDAIVLAARARLGAIPGTGLNNIAPSRRLYAGGGGSVRGYGYQQIGPRDTAGDPSGGRSLSEFSLEARIGTGIFDGALQVVPFVDAGAVDETPTPRLRDLRIGAGVGVRFKTGFGPIRVDVATPLNRQPGDSRVAVYVALGQAF